MLYRINIGNDKRVLLTNFGKRQSFAGLKAASRRATQLHDVYSWRRLHQPDHRSTHVRTPL